MYEAKSKLFKRVLCVVLCALVVSGVLIAANFAPDKEGSAPQVSIEQESSCISVPQEPHASVSIPDKKILVDLKCESQEMKESTEISEETEPSESEVGEEALNYTPEDLEMLAIVIYCEAGADSVADSTRQMVGEVVLNRVASECFPNTIYEVLTAPYQYGSFAWTGVVWPERATQVSEAHAVARAYECAESLLSGSAERLLPFETVFQSGGPQGTVTVVYQDGIYFCG